MGNIEVTRSKYKIRWMKRMTLLFSGQKYWDDKGDSWHSQGLFYLIGRARDIVMGRFQRQKQFCYPTSFKEILKCILCLSRKLLIRGMMKLTGAVLLSGKSKLVQNLGLLLWAKNRKLLKQKLLYEWWKLLMIGNARESSGGRYWMDLSRSEIIKDFDINFHSLSSENFHSLSSITWIKFWLLLIPAGFDPVLYQIKKINCDALAKLDEVTCSHQNFQEAAWNLFKNKNLWFFFNFFKTFFKLFLKVKGPPPYSGQTLFGPHVHYKGRKAEMEKRADTADISVLFFFGLC